MPTFKVGNLQGPDIFQANDSFSNGWEVVLREASIKLSSTLILEIML